MSESAVTVAALRSALAEIANAEAVGATDEYDRAGRPVEAGRLRAEGRVLRSVIEPI